MIGMLRGELLLRNLDTQQCTVGVAGVGYEVSVPRTLLQTLNEGSSVQLWIHTHVREDTFSLYGFLREQERSVFRLLLTVSGLGPKTALAVLSEHAPRELIHLIVEKQAKEIARAQGIGQRLAERIVVELQGKVEKIAWESWVDSSTTFKSVWQDVASALVNLGYGGNDARFALENLKRSHPNPEFETLLKLALQELSGRVQEGGHA